MTITTTYQLTNTIGRIHRNTYKIDTEFGSTVVSNGGNGFLLSYGFSTGTGWSGRWWISTTRHGHATRGFLIPTAAIRPMWT